uniref:Midasin n=2 Tax=Caenorhabditis tropicalis TaxID=1561998 RepID=A0A1I7TDS8_9PELO
MQMGDEIDSKTLFGSYHCTEVAGQFIWRESSFAKWLQAPGIILLEDIDTANADVISKILDIATHRQNDPSNTDKNSHFHNDARIIATMSGKGKKVSVLDGVPVRIRVEQLTEDELKRLASKAFPRIAHLARTLINTFRKIENVPGTGNSRQLTSTDFLRGCARLALLPDISANVESFAELIDVWCLADQKQRSSQLCSIVASSLNVNPDRVHTHLSVRQPEVKYDESVVSIGRTSLPRKISMIKTGRHKLGHTRDVVQLMERVVVCVSHNEPLLLVGETGVGKTSVVQAVADLIGVTLDVVNVSPTSDSDELIQGYKPITIGRLMEPFTKFYIEVFTENFDVKNNQKFIDNLEKCLSSGRFKDYLSLVEATANKALQRKTKNKDERWAELLVRAKKIRDGIEKGAAPFALQKGAVLEAAEKGHWLLVDEINLAPPECLDAIVHALSASGTHPNFRLFACMNPATDAGKRRLPPGVRSRFTEFFVSETSDPFQLALIVSAYLPTVSQQFVENLVNFYLSAKQLYPSSYSLRTLCRALLFTSDNMFGSLEQSVYEAVSMAFLTNLEKEEKGVMQAKIRSVFRCKVGLMPVPKESHRYINIGGYYLERGVLLPESDSKYVITKTVKINLAEIARIVCSGRFPILLEGETSAGKTSIVCHLAKATGNRIVRINNHEHTDVQEYMGSYVADSGGRLVFREGALVQAVRDGSWVILDELNLAPTDVIEALNRLLDDNRELFVPEINETIKAHPRFRLFATQNPAGSYAGRKRLSRALMSRFIVLRFNHLPIDELSEMVCARCQVPPNAALKMIEVLNELRTRRSLSGLFSARDGLMTLRDVFRWAKRMTTDETTDDWLQVLVNHGFFLLAGRCRSEKDEVTVVETLEKVIKRKIDKNFLFSLNSPYMPTDVTTENVVLTLGMRRMLVMTEQAWIRDEAVLMVGETGGGKTTLSEVVGRGKLRSINCHERTETADLLGRLRPKHDGGFEWSDGVVISAMRDGAPLLVDEISLAEDSVLERLNPLFEEGRSLLLSDAGTEAEIVESKPGFQMIATMNPGGDYGKKELSKALKNRFTEVWTSNDYTSSELVTIFDQRLARVDATKEEARISPTRTAISIVSWITVFFGKYSHVFRHAPSVRDIVACAELYASAVRADIDRPTAIKDALCAVFLDSLAGLTTRLHIDPIEVFKDALDMLHKELVKNELLSQFSDVREFTQDTMNAVIIDQSSDHLKVGELKIIFGPATPVFPKGFSLTAPTCTENLHRIARGLLIKKPILLEGAPGCGKSSTVMALAQLTGNPITRLNLSDQTDLSDLFGSDVPFLTEDGTMTFRWEDGPVLKAIKKGEWILLDEMNLASQAVLEGLNACFDHRRVLYIAELNREFEIPATSNCRFFACQNPRVQGGNRRALPKSFINRFTNIYTNDLSKTDVEIILKEVDKKHILTDEQRNGMVTISEKCEAESEKGIFLGGPFSFNLRDLLRWYDLLKAGRSLGDGFDMVYMARTRRDEDKELMRSIYEKTMNERLVGKSLMLTVDEKEMRIGKCTLNRSSQSAIPSNRRLLASQIVPMHQIATCVELNWLTLLVGPRNCGKRATVENVANVCGRKLKSIALNADTDAQELIGSYEQVVDENCFPDAKAKIIEILKQNNANEDSIKRVQDTEDLIKLEGSVEWILAETGNIEEIRDILSSANQSSMRFEWTDSVFVDAYLHGDWLLIEDVNLCSAAVLDRLNSCLEAGGKLVVAERQNSFEPLEPHPDFRVFLSMDSKVGEISRAMRNRSVEIYFEENTRWNTSPDDVRTVIGTKVTTEWSKAASCDLTAEQQLHLAALLEDDNELFSPEVAWKLIGGRNRDYMEEDMDDDEIILQSSILSPRIQDISELNGIYEKYVVATWQRAAVNTKTASVEAIPMTFLSASPWMISNLVEEFKLFFGSPVVDAIIKRIPIDILEPNKRHLVDPEFSSASASSSGVKFSRAILFEWILQMISKIPVDQNSADHLSSTMTKYEMATCDVTFTNLAEISSLVRFIVEMFKSSTPLSKKPSREVCISISYLLLVAASRRKLTARTGCAAIYLAWNDLKNELSNIRGFACPKNLSSISEKINEGWSSESYETFVTEYIHRWKKFAICQPFTDENQSRLFVETIEKVLGEETVETDVEMTDESMEDDDETKKRLIAVSPIELSTKVVESVETLFEFLTTGVADLENEIFKKTNVYSGVEWKDHKYSRWIRTAAVFCSCIASGKLSEEETEDQNILVSDLASVGGGAHSIATRLFFSTIHYNPTMSNLSIAHLQKFPIKELGSKLWRLAVNSSSIHKTMRNVLKQLGIGLEGWTSGSTNGMACGIEMMEKSLPPKETLDPVIFEEERVLFVKAKRRIVERQLKYLAEWRILMGRQPTECDYSSSQVIIKGLNTLKEELSQLENEDQDHCSVVYRQSATQYNQLCAEMRSFLDVSKSAISDARNSEGEFNDKTMIIRLARVKSFAMSAENFRISILRKFVSFVDVSMPFIAGLLIIEIAFNEIALKWRQEAKKLHAQTSSAFPRILQTKASSSGLVSNEMLNWASRDGSPMPLHLKAAVVRRKLTEIEHFDSSSITEIQWTRAQWKKWYEKNIAKAEQKDFVYRTKTEEEKDELDIEEFFANLEQDSQVLPDSDVSMLLEAVEKKKFSLIDEKSRKQSDERYEMALVWMRYVMSEVGAIPAKNSVWSQCVDGDQKLFEILAAHEGLSDDDNGEDTRIIDVYRNSSLRECRRVAVILERLSTRTRQVLERWPEVVALKTIISTIEEFFSVSVSTPHIKIATQIENLIEVCEQWEMMADRANSLREPLGDLRKLLVDWKKMEVRCWSSLLVNCENEAKQRAQLVSFPLFESLFEATTPEMESAIIPMSIEWMHNSTLIDFATRVRSVESLSKWAKIAGKEVLAIQLEAASRHFGMLIERVDQRLKDAREPAEKCLKDYLKVVKYNDLNLWNIRVSSTKAHAQLYKIVRRFKDSINEELHDDFGILQAVDEWKRRVFELSTDCVIEKDLVGEELEKRIRQVKKFSNEITDKVSILCETSAIEELHEQTKAADEAIRTMINYTGEDEEKEKQQGYARNSRQRLVAMMIKECQAVGLNARKAILLEQETINRQSIIEVLSGEECEKEMRICASGRNIVIQKSNKIDQQVGVSTRKHLSGMIEYGMAYMLSLQKNIGNWKSQISKIRKHSQTLKVICENQRDVWIVDHGLISERVSKMVELISTIEVLVGSIKHRIDLIPETCEEKIRLKTHLHPLSKLSKSDETAKKLTDWAEKLSTLTSNLKRTNERLAEFYVFKSTDFIVWRTQLNGDSQELLADLGMFDGYFETEKEQITEALKEISIWTKHVDSCETAEEAETDVTSLLLLVQTIYKKLEGVTRGEEDKALDQINILVDILKQCNIESVTNSLASVVEQCSHGGMIIKQLEGLVELSNITVGIIEMSLVQLTNCLGYFCVFYHSMLSMTMQLYEKGYVNTIPKAEKQESGDGQTDDSGEGGGIGEGGTAKDAKDVTEEMEETGQIEGLEDEQPADSEEHEAKNDNEKPIDMEDDFAEDLQDIDKNEKGDQEDGEDQSDEEPEVEDQMGDVEEEDDKQLDPKMWDEEEKDQEQQKNMDQEQQAADDQTDEMVAKEDDAQTKDQDQEKEGQEDNEQEEKEEQENMDERDRENDDRDENHMDTSEPNNDEENIEKGEIDEIEDGDDGDETDKEDEDAIEGEGEEEQNENQEQEEIDESKQVNEEESEEKMDDEALEQGTGGEKNDQDDNKDVAEGGLAEEDEKEDQEDKDEKGDGKSKSDPNGDGSKATDDALMEEAEMGEGEENETGQQMENAEISDRQMVGKGTIEEARQTKREEKREEEKKKRRELKDALEGEAGEEGGEVEDGNADEAKEAHIHMAAHEMFTVMKEEQNELVVGITDDQENQSADGSEEVEHSRMNDKADEQWAAMSRTVGMLAAELAENLRLILEPQRANKMQGDYRSGKRLNMRRLIPYIASEYRKDRIWMRRTKRAQREYQILIAVDDSESMNENGIHQSTCESVCIVEDALRRCDAGRVSVCSFGADVKTIVPFGEASASSSIEMLKQMTFSQKKTDLLSLLKTAKHQLNEIRTPTSEQMLIVISDGRGALSQGADKVRALYSDLQGVTVLFIILDSGKKSIEDHTVASFTDNKVVLTPYLALFPFPFYALVKSVQQLPTIIAESIRQWFEMTMQHS